MILVRIAKKRSSKNRWLCFILFNDDFNDDSKRHLKSLFFMFILFCDNFSEDLKRCLQI